MGNESIKKKTQKLFIEPLEQRIMLDGAGASTFLDLIDERNQQQIKIDKSQIQQANTGDIVILKGALYPNASPVIHRSPSIEESNEQRLLLRVDTNNFTGFGD